MKWVARFDYLKMHSIVIKVIIIITGVTVRFRAVIYTENLIVPTDNIFIEFHNFPS